MTLDLASTVWLIPCRWHETQAVYSCDFQPLPPAQLKRLLPTANEDEDKDGKDKEKDKVVAGGRSYRLATAGGDSKVRVGREFSQKARNTQRDVARLMLSAAVDDPP